MIDDPAEAEEMQCQMLALDGVSEVRVRDAEGMGEGVNATALAVNG